MDRDPIDSLNAPERAALAVSRAHALVPLLAEHAAEAERLREPTRAVIDALLDSRILELLVPRCHGGLELDLDTFLEVGVTLGEGDASMAWVACFYIEHNWLLCHFPEPFQRELFRDRSCVLAPAMVAPTGVATRDGSGYRVRGRWQWATGISHADWVLVSAQGDEDPRFFAMPVEAVKVEDTWFVDGMSGTGSHDVVVDDVRVPEERSLPFLDMSAGCAVGARIHASPVYRTPMAPVLTMATAMPALGQAHMVLRLFRERMQERVLYATTTKQAESVPAQILLARAEVDLRTADLLLRDTVADVMRLRTEALIEDRARWMAQFAAVVNRCRDVVRQLVDASGASTHFLASPLQRALRDVQVLAGHAVLDLDARLEAFGRARLGLDPKSTLL